MWRRGWIVLRVSTIAALLGATLAVPAAGQQGVESSSGRSNVALGQPAEQSSTAYGGTADRAVDGDTDGDFFADSVTHTSNGPGEWWQVDLGAVVDIREIVVWNRTDCCAERLHDVLVLVSEDPFPPTAVSDPTGWSAVIRGVAGRETRISVAASGRYVRVQQAATEYLSLAEVEVWAAQETPAVTLEPAPTGPSGPLQLTRVALPAGLGTGGLWQVIAGGPGYIAVGALGRINPKALIMTSVDGDSWQRSRLTGTAAAGEILDVTAFSGGYAAIGRAASGFRTVIWLSANGVDWEAIADARVLANTKPAAITERSGGLYAVGCSVHADGVCSQSLAWVSTDGRAWTRSTLTLGGGWQLDDVDSQGDRLLVVGSQQIPPFHAVAAVSDGSAKWRQHEGDGDGFLSQALLLDDGTAIAVGMQMASTAPQLGLLESSQDGGASWQPMDVGAPPGSGFRGISVADDTLIFGEQAQPDGTEGKAEMWQLDANSQLQRVAWEDEELPAASGIVGFTPFTGSRGGVAVGSVDPDPNSSGQPAVWLLEPMQAPGVG